MGQFVRFLIDSTRARLRALQVWLCSRLCGPEAAREQPVPAAAPQEGAMRDLPAEARPVDDRNRDGWTRGEMYATTLFLEKSTPECEDAEPLLVRCGPEKAILAVFDGLGGAGSAPASLNGRGHTGAWVAAQLAREIVDGFVRSRHDELLAQPEAAVAALRATLASRFREQAAVSCQPVRVTSSLIRRLPTTLALVAFDAAEPAVAYTAVWAGDSRAYLLSPEGGLRQLTQDDLRAKLDALENLSADSPLSNYVNADSDFRLNSVSRRAGGAAIFLVATDGCFGYLYSPMHFEYLVLETLLEANDEADWATHLWQRLEPVTGDDCSLAAAGVGYATFDAMRDAFRARRDALKTRFIDELDRSRSDALRLSGELRNAEAQLSALLRRSWEAYRCGYDPIPEGEHAQE